MQVTNKLEYYKSTFRVQFRYSERALTDIKALPANSRRFEAPSTWVVKTLPNIALPLKEFCDKYKLEITSDAKTALDYLLSTSGSVPFYGNIELSAKGNLAIVTPYNYDLQQRLSAFKAKWEKDTGSYRVNIMYVKEVIELLPNFILSAEVRAIAYPQVIKRPRIVCPPLTGEIAPGVKLFPHQIEGIKEIVELRYALLADDMGLGKTIQALVGAKILSQGLIPIYVLCPASLQPNWEIEAEMLNVKISVHSNDTQFQDPMRDFILISDESDAFSNLSAKRTQKFDKLTQSPYLAGLIELTGTPTRNGQAIELLPLLKAAKHPLAAKPGYYIERYCTDNAPLEELHNRLTRDIPGDPLSKRVMVRRTDEILNLPPLNRVMRTITWSDTAKREYEQTFLQLQQDYRAKAGNKGISFADALVLLTHLRMAGSKANIEYSTNLAKQLISQGEPVVVFSEFVDTIRTIANNLGGAIVDGSVSNKQIEKAKQIFQRGQLPAICATFRRGGVGHTLTRARNVILVDRAWTPGAVRQAEKRIHRIGQTRECFSYWIQATSTHKKIDYILMEKKDKIDLMMHGKVLSAQVKSQNIEAMGKELAASLFGM